MASVLVYLALISVAISASAVNCGNFEGDKVKCKNHPTNCSTIVWYEGTKDEVVYCRQR